MVPQNQVREFSLDAAQPSDGANPLTLMPLLMGMGFGVNWNVAAMTQALPSLVGHLVFGIVLGITYPRFGQRHHWGPTPHHAGAA
jgi:hypothetical protein